MANFLFWSWEREFTNSQQLKEKEPISGCIKNKVAPNEVKSYMSISLSYDSRMKRKIVWEQSACEGSRFCLGGTIGEHFDHWQLAKER